MFTSSAMPPDFPQGTSLSKLLLHSIFIYIDFTSIRWLFVIFLNTFPKKILQYGLFPNNMN